MFLLTEFQNYLPLTFVQDGTVGLPAPGQGDTSAIVADSGSSNLNETPQLSPFGDNFFMMLMLILLGMIVFSFLGGRKQKKQRASMLDSLKNMRIKTRDGYRLQLFESSQSNEAKKIMSKFDKSLPDSLYLVFDAPLYKIHYGNFITKDQQDNKHRQTQTESQDENTCICF